MRPAEFVSVGRFGLRKALQQHSIVFRTSVSTTGKALLVDRAGGEDRYFDAAIATELQAAFDEILAQ